MGATSAPFGTRPSCRRDRSAAGSEAITWAGTVSPPRNSTVISSIACTTCAAVMTLPSAEMRTPEPISLKRTCPVPADTSRPLALITTTDALTFWKSSATLCALAGLCVRKTAARLTSEPSMRSFMASPDVTDGESFGERIVGIDDVAGEAGDPRLPAQRGHDRGVLTDLRLRDEPAREDRPQNAFVAEVLVEPELAARVQRRHARARAGAARRAIDHARPRRRLVPVERARRYRHHVLHVRIRTRRRSGKLRDRGPREPGL